MAKSKSSASSATRKKHVRKATAAAGPSNEPPLPKEKKAKGKDKKNKEPRKKVYIPPVKPAPVQPDPLDTLGVAQIIPPELLVVLRRLAKKDSTTKRRALEELQAGWVDKAKKEGPTSEILHVLVDIIPVWFHHVPALFLHPSRRIRLLAVGVHSSLLQMPDIVRDQLFFFLREVASADQASADQAEYIIGSWCMAAHDADRQVSSLARETWAQSVSLTTEESRPLVLAGDTFKQLWEFVLRTILDPNGVYLYVNPPQAAALPPPPHQQKKGASRPAQARKDKEEEASARAKAEEDEESEQDRKGRLRVGALRSAEWIINSLAKERKADMTDKFLSPLGNPALWSALYHGQTPPFVQFESIGYSQPGVRRAAWSLLQTLLGACEDHLNPLLSMLSSPVLRSAWVEPDNSVRDVMMVPLLLYLRRYPEAWKVDAQPADDEDEDRSGSESEGEVYQEKSLEASNKTTPRSQAYSEFLQYLQLGCAGSPTQGYPAVPIILATIPPMIVGSLSSTPLDDLFTSFWAALDGRALSALDRSAASAAFLDALLLCVNLVVGRLMRGSLEDSKLLICGAEGESISQDGVREAALRMVKEQFARIWEELSSGRLRVEGNKATALMMRPLVSFNNIDREFFQVAWQPLASGIKKQVDAEDAPIPPLISTMLSAFKRSFEAGSEQDAAAQALIREVVQSAIAQLQAVLEGKDPLSSEHLSSLVSLFDAFASTAFGGSSMGVELEEKMRQHIERLVLVLPSLLRVYVSHCPDETRSLRLWQDVLNAIAKNPEESSKELTSLLDLAIKNELPSFLKPQTPVLDELAGGLLADALSEVPPTSKVTTMRGLLCYPDHFISRSCFEGLVRRLSSAFTRYIPDAFRDDAFSLDAFDVPLEMFDALAEKQPDVLFSVGAIGSVLPDMFFFAYLLPTFRTVNAQGRDVARMLWIQWATAAGEEAASRVSTVIAEQLRDLLLDCSVIPTPGQILQFLSGSYPGFDVAPMDLLPPKSTFDSMLNELPAEAIDASLAVIDPIIPTSLGEGEATEDEMHDRLGFSRYARAVYALLLHLADDRTAARENPWALRHLLAISMYAGELLQSPRSHGVVFSNQASRTALQDVVTKVGQISAYVLSSEQGEGWHATVVKAITTENQIGCPDDIGRLLYDLIALSRSEDTVREARILRTLLQHLLGSASKTDAEQWILLARKLEKQAPFASLAIVYSVTQCAPEPPILDRYRNELAASTLGVPPSKANTEGLWHLRRLAASAPDPESDVVFLPQLRAVNLMKACQQWITSDEDLDEEVESEMTLVFFHLVPILQNVPGAHWDLIFDVMENNLENSALTEPSTLATLSRTLRLFITIQDLATTNKALRTIWQEREATCLTLIRDMIVVKLDESKMSTPLSICRELALQIVQDLPESLIDKNMLPQTCHIITDSSFDVQRMAYQLLHEAARKYTEHMVIEAAVDSDEQVKVELPSELIEILQRSLNDDPDELHQEYTGYLLAWMVAFDLFTNASLKVKSGYIDQLRDLNLVGDHLLPNILSILGLYGSLSKSFKLNIWDIGDIYLDLCLADSPLSLRLLAAHVYYRALFVVPSLIRAWLSECRDRQLFKAVTSYTSTHFSPLIISAELSQLRDPSVMSDLVDETFTVKVAGAVNEVTASYAVDENHLEITVKLPSDYPLHGIEVSENQRIGVPEHRWRSWVLGVQQILTFRSGSIVDGLSFFKKNVSSFFEGLTECAICYSVICAIDGTVPRQPCKTCKNRFHSACLYKWFKSSHTSSCPLCRSELI
ncbi:uncharacterized protein LAESUDRAFT_708574 [Laetiporus sulphureus 93-53]|uniref:E3 ubiquitin-protein ligase listerin n=1 Tax=Laetiporus sulphureus 93-53 TaxID=1314785 RepID=A0A165BAV3_9APHY|nr:uncharacterized protein LAESUDRAFT_708574 [Laetiporus sulphureus 93-53]KZT00638.1 hypothetical protein LAESUDRAFT_708574 [Laetiporus sulphureus 93-53]